jgi:anaerobic magnesium-protoporphyrin IX monomethyl ester cyclase
MSIDVLVVRPPQIIEEPTSYRVPGHHIVITTLIQKNGLESRYFNVDFLRNPRPFQYAPVSTYKNFNENIIKVKSDFLNEKNKKWLNFIRIFKKFDPKSILILPKDVYHIDSSIFLARLSKKINEKIKIGISGYPSNYFYKLLLNNCIDFVVVNDPLYTIPLAFKGILRGKDLKKIPNIAYKKNKKFTFTKKVTKTKDLDFIPVPNRELIIERKYYPPSSLGDILVSTGCIYSCRFCALANSRFLLRSPKNVVKEIKDVYEKYGTRDFSFQTASINLNRKWLIELCKEIKREKLRILWSAYANAIGIDESIVKLMKESGCWKLGIGFESGSQKILKEMNKPLRIEDSLKVVRILKRNKIFIYGSFIAGYPGENIEDLLSTLNIIRELKLDVFRINLLVPKPRNKFFNMRKDNKFLEYSSSNIKIRTIDDKIFKEFWNDLYPLSVLQEKILFRRYFLNPSIIYKKISEYLRYFLKI